MKHSWLKVAAVVAGVIFGANGSFAAENEWRYYAANEAGNPTNMACVVKSPWVLSIAYEWGRLCFNTTAGTITLDQALGGDGVLDLRDMVVEYSVTDSDELSRVAITGLSFDQGYPWQNFQGCKATEFYANHAVRLPEFGGSAYLRKVYIEGDQVTVQKDGYQGFRNSSYLTNVVLKCPNMTSYSGFMFSGAHLTNDVNEVVSSAAQSFGQGVFSGYLTGSLVLTNLVTGVGALSALSVTNLYLEGPYAGTAGTHSEQLFRGNGTFETVTLKWANVTNYADAGYNNFANLREITFCMTNLVSVRENAFVWAGKLEKVTILGKVLGTNCVDEMVKSFTGYTDAADLPLERGNRLYVSKKLGWADAEKMPGCDKSYKGTKPEGCFGVYKNAAGYYKAWMIHLPQAEDPTGLCIRVQ